MNKIKIFLITVILAAGAGHLPVFAEAKYSLKEMTPAVEAALEGRRERFDELTAFKDKGAIGENNRGYIEVLAPDSGAKALAEAENKDRVVIYKTIAQQNGLTAELETIEKVFAQVQHDKAKPGAKIQNDDGQWGTK